MIIEFTNGQTEQINDVLEIKADYKRLVIVPKEMVIPITYPIEGIKSITFDKPLVKGQFL